jgi:hypothetical protein
MSVYKEAFYYINKISQACLNNPIWNDSCDSGLPVTKGDSNWINIEYHLLSHAIKATRRASHGQITITIALIDEWTTKQYAFYELTYTKVTNTQSLITPCSGFYEIRRVMPTEHELIANLIQLDQAQMNQQISLMPTRFDRHANMSMTTLKAIGACSTALYDVAGKDRETLLNYLAGLYDGYDYGDAIPNAPFMQLVKAQKPALYTEIINIVEECRTYPRLEQPYNS